jgi:hypothetical protein
MTAWPASPVTAYGVGPTEAPTLAEAGPTPGAGLLPFPGAIPRDFWQSSAFGLLLLILAFAYVTGRLTK